MQDLTRRRFLRHAAAGAAAFAGGTLIARSASAARVVIVGGGPAGVAAALALRQAAVDASILLIERDPARLAGPGQAAGPFMRPNAPADHQALRQAGVEIALDDVTGLDWRAGRLELFSGRREAFDRLILAPGTSARDEEIDGYGAVARHDWPAAWGSAREARRLAAQLGAMRQDGHVILRLPPRPVSHPAVAAERARRIADYLARTRPAARLTVLDGDRDSEARPLFAARAGKLAARVDWRDAASGGTVLSVDPGRGRIETNAGVIHADVVNFVTPQEAAPVARLAGLVDESGWCPCDAAGQSRLRPEALVIGDARLGAMRDLAAATGEAETAARGIAGRI